jgi:hypothetical protein
MCAAIRDVIASDSEAIQSREGSLDCFVAFGSQEESGPIPFNEGQMDCPTFITGGSALICRSELAMTVLGGDRLTSSHSR